MLCILNIWIFLFNLFKLNIIRFCSPKNRFLRITKDEHYSPDLHCLTNVVALAENTCAYDIDPIDEAWLRLYNGDRAQCGAFPINETQFERVIEELEVNTHKLII